MSSFIFENGNIIEFNQYCLSESISPIKTAFGTNKDFNNLEFISPKDGVIITSFIQEDILYTIMYLNSEIGFHRIKLNDISDNYLDSIFKQDNNVGPIDAIKVFSKVLYIIIEMVKKFNLKEIKFQGENTKLDKMYSNLVKNKVFLNELNKIGFNLVQGSKFIFRKQKMSYRGYLQEINESLIDSVKEKFKGVIDKLPKGFDYNITINGMQISKDKVNLVFIDKKNVDKADEMIKMAIELDKHPIDKKPVKKNLGKLDWEKHKD